MTHDQRTDPRDPNEPTEETRPVERQTYVEREQHYDPPPAQQSAPAGGSQVNVNADRGGYAAPAAPGPLYYARRVVSLIFGILTVLLVLRILLLLLVANETNPIVDVIYAITEPFVAPFRGIFNFDVVSPGGGSVLDIAALVALIGWFLIYLLIMAILSIGDRRATTV